MPESTATIPLEDGSALTKAAWTALAAERRAAGFDKIAIGPLDEFLTAAERTPLGFDERTKVLDQAALMLNHLYPHLPFKLEHFNFIHPVAYLEKNVRPFLKTMAEVTFHGHVIAAFSLVRDAHTLYGLPSPFRGAVAFLPFQLRFYVQNNVRRYVVSKVMSGFKHETFQPGAEILRWSGFAVEAVVQALAGRLPGGNEDAAVTRGTFHLTLRPLTFCQPPGQQEKLTPVLEHRAPGSEETRQILLPWGVANGIDLGHAFPSDGFSVNSTHDHADLWQTCMNACVHAPAKKAPPVPPRPPTPAEAALSLPSNLPDTFEVQFTGGPSKPGVVESSVLTTDPPSDARVGYLRIRRFSDGSSAGNTAGIVDEFRRLLTLLDEVAHYGLIIDLRSNPGGDVIAAEQMLQMLTPIPIQPAPFHLANTPAVLNVLQQLSKARNNRANLSAVDDVKLTEALASLEPWLPDAANLPPRKRTGSS